MHFRIHTVGASGSGTTTLASALAVNLELPHFDADDYYWEKTDPPYTSKRAASARLQLLQSDLAKQASWVLSGSLVGWGDALMTSFTHVVFLYIPAEIRLHRLKHREHSRFGTRIEKGGDMAAIHADLMIWAAKYDQGGLEVRSKVMHEQWLQKLNCSVIRIEGDLTTAKQVALVRDQLL